MTQAFDIGVCTFRRPHLAETLKSLAALQLPEGWSVRVIVADNDDTPSAKALAEQTAKDTGLAITYVHAPARNISIARNACLDAAAASFLAFVDDDEMVTPVWLAALHSALAGSNADAALGPVEAVYGPDAADWIKKGGYHSASPVWQKGEINTGYTGNVLFRRASPAFSGLRFRNELGHGGEDTDFFARLTRAGGRIVYAPEALATEAVPPDRATLSWLFRRRFRCGETNGLVLLEQDAAAGGRLKNIAMAMIKTLFCSGMALLLFYNGARMRFWLLRGALHLGTFMGLLERKRP